MNVFISISFNSLAFSSNLLFLGHGFHSLDCTPLYALSQLSVSICLISFMSLLIKVSKSTNSKHGSNFFLADSRFNISSSKFSFTFSIINLPHIVFAKSVSCTLNFSTLSCNHFSGNGTQLINSYVFNIISFSGVSSLYDVYKSRSLRNSSSWLSYFFSNKSSITSCFIISISVVSPTLKFADIPIS